MININKIARQVMAMQFNYYNQNNIIILSNNENGYIEYFIQKNNDKYNVLKIKDLKQIQKEFSEYSIEQLNQFLFGCNYDDFINYKQQLIEKQYFFNQEELQQFFVSSNKIKMDPLSFFKIFGIHSNCFQFMNKYGINIYIEKQFDRNIVDKCLKMILSLPFSNILNNICLIFTNEIVQRDGHLIGGNYVKNIDQYDAQFVISSINPTFDLMHQIGHYIAQQLFTDKELKDIFVFVKKSQIFNFQDNYYKTNQNECFAQLIAHYYNHKFNRQSETFVEEVIINKT